MLLYFVNLTTKCHKYVDRTILVLGNQTHKQNLNEDSLEIIACVIILSRPILVTNVPIRLSKLNRAINNI